MFVPAINTSNCISSFESKPSVERGWLFLRGLYDVFGSYLQRLS